MAGIWSRSDDPPTGEGKAGFYATALRQAAPGDPARARLARCLVWCDARACQYSTEYFDWYKESARAFPDDERSQFFVAALCWYKILPGSPETEELAATTYARLLQRDWIKSPYWKRFALFPDKMSAKTARLIAADHATVTDERIALVEAALEKASSGAGEAADVAPFVYYLAAAYRATERTDEQAEEIFRAVFQKDPDDAANTLFLAKMYRAEGREDMRACTVYAQCVALSAGQDEEADLWTICLARAYIALGRIDESTLSILQRAARVSDGDIVFASAALYALSSVVLYGGAKDADTSARLEDAVGREREILPQFLKRHWDWNRVVRALAQVYGEQGRTDETAKAIYTRVADGGGEQDSRLWILLARAYAARNDASETAIKLYEKALVSAQCGDAVRVALGRAYVAVGAQNGRRRQEALATWETLYRQGLCEPEMLAVLARIYAEENRGANDIALALWTQAVDADAKDGALRLRLAHELKMRGDLEAASRYYKEAARLLPQDFTAQYETALLMKEHLSDAPGAIKLLQKAVKLGEGEKHLGAHFALGEALLARDKRTEAKVVFQNIVDKIDSEHTPTLLHLAKLNLKYNAAGVKQAEALYEQAANIDPDHPETYRRMADLYREKGQSAEEEQALEKYLSLSTPDAEHLRQLADLYLRRGEYSRAESMLRQIIALGAADRKLYTLLGEVIIQARGNAQAA